MSDTIHSEGSRYDELRKTLRSALPLSGNDKLLTRRRFFLSLMAAGAAALAVPRRTTAQELGFCNAQLNTCEPNECGENTCTQKNVCNAGNMCMQVNVCNGTNICNAPGDTCAGKNSCGTNQHNNCGGGGNRCNANLCSTNNTCATNTCTQNRCYKYNTCMVANNCNPNYCVPSQNNCGSGNQCNNNDNVQPLPFPALGSSMGMTLNILRELRGRGDADPFGFEA